MLRLPGGPVHFAVQPLNDWRPLRPTGDPLRREFLHYVLSYEGQMVVIDDGYLPLLPKTVAKSLKSIHLQTEPATAIK